MTVVTSGAAGNLREQILSAAASCFRERGIKATKMQEIAKRAGISVGNFYNYFENKDAIIDEFAQREVARLAREIDEIVNGRVSLEEQRRQFRESLRKQLAVQRARVKIEIIEEAARNSSMGEIVKRSDAQVRELIKKMHRSRSSAEVSDEEIEVMVEMDMALVDGMAFRLIAHPELDIERMINAIVATNAALPVKESSHMSGVTFSSRSQAATSSLE